MQTHLKACRSAPHRAVLGLLRPALGLDVPDGLAEDLAASQPERIVEAAVQGEGRILPLFSAAFENAPELRDCIPRDLYLFLDEMFRANTERNAEFLEQLAVIGKIFAREGIEAIALKGAAELLSPTWPEPARRFLSDIDILVREDDREAAADALLAAGGERVAGSQPDFHHDAWIMLAPYDTVIELHWGLGRETIPDVPPVATMFATSLPSSVDGLQVGHLRERVVHQSAHDILMHRGFQMRQPLSLRSAVDLFVRLERLSDDDRRRVREAAAQFGMSRYLDGLYRLAATLLGDRPWLETAGGGRWVARKLRRFGEGQAQGNARISDAAWDMVDGLVFDAERRRSYVRRLLDPRDLARSLSEHRALARKKPK